MKKTLLTVTVLGSLLIGTQAFADDSPLSANIGATTNYMWRGMTQSDGHPAIQGGLDYAAPNGLYVGTWASNERFVPPAAVDGVLKKGTELDLYGGYKKTLKNNLALDVGVVKYNYPSHNSTEFSEAYIKPSYKGIGAEVDYTIQSNNVVTNQKGDVYYGLGYTGTLKNDWSYGAKAGRYNYKASAQRYNNGELSLTKTVKKAGDFTLAVDKASGAWATAANNGKNDARISLTWKKTLNF